MIKLWAAFNSFLNCGVKELFLANIELNICIYELFLANIELKSVCMSYF